jgi:hypothetical protein
MKNIKHHCGGYEHVIIITYSIYNPNSIDSNVVFQKAIKYVMVLHETHDKTSVQFKHNIKTAINSIII